MWRKDVGGRWKWKWSWVGVGVGVGVGDAVDVSGAGSVSQTSVGSAKRLPAWHGNAWGWHGRVLRVLLTPRGAACGLACRSL